MTIDTARIKQSVDLVELAGRSVELRKAAADEYAGPCPKCGGTDRLHVKRDWWFCRQCWPAENGRGHDAIAFVMWRDDVDFRTACTRLDAGAVGSDAPRRPPAQQATPMPPGDLWQTKARQLIAEAQYILWEDTRAEWALGYLHGRGLSDDTIRAARLGCVIANGREDRTAWGLPTDDEHPRLSIPRGIVIPCEDAGRLWYVKIRRPDADVTEKVPKYHALAGSVRTLYGVDLVGKNFDTLMLVEGEINSLSIWQVARADGLDRLDVASFGSESNNAGGARAHTLAGRYHRVIVWLDDPDKVRAAMAALPGARGLRSVEQAGKKLDASALLYAGALGDFLSEALARLDRTAAGEIMQRLANVTRPTTDRLALGWQWLDAEAGGGRADTPVYQQVLDMVEVLNEQYMSEQDAAQVATI